MYNYLIIKYTGVNNQKQISLLIFVTLNVKIKSYYFNNILNSITKQKFR